MPALLMSNIANLSAASGLTVLRSYAASVTSQTSDGLLSKSSSGNASSSATSVSASDGAQPNISLTLTTSYKGVTEAVVNHQIDQGAAGSTEQGLAADIQGVINGYEQNYSNSSAQIQAALYSGGGLADPGSPNLTDTWSQFESMRNTVSGQIADLATTVNDWLSAGRPQTYGTLNTSSTGFGSMSDDQVRQFVQNGFSSADRMSALTSTLNTAFQNHTLTFEKATDVAGLNYDQTTTWNVSGNEVSAPGSLTYNTSMVSWDPHSSAAVTTTTTGQREDHTLVFIGGVALYASWEI